MSNFPISLDDDVSLPIVNNNISEIGEEAINALREAVFNIETEVGIGSSGTVGTIADRLGVSLEANGTLKPSAITGLGLVVLPITNSEIDASANITESKLLLNYPTNDLHNSILNTSADAKEALGWISISGMKLDPHILGAFYKHTLYAIDVSSSSADFFQDKFTTPTVPSYRINDDSYQAIRGINDELLAHQFADGSAVGPKVIKTNSGKTYSENYAHTSSGVFLDTSNFHSIPETKQDLQAFANYIDESGIFLYGTRIQNLYSNGVSRQSRSATLASSNSNPMGMSIVPRTNVITYLCNHGDSSSPVDDIEFGDDIVEFKPAAPVMASNLFDSQFLAIKIGDIIRITYTIASSQVEVPFIIKEKKYIGADPKRYFVRIDGKNLAYQTDTVGRAQVDKPLLNNNKFGVLAVAAANNTFGAMPSLIVGSPTGAVALGLGFNPDLIDLNHYNLYLALYPSGNPADGYEMYPVDVSGNRGKTPGKYTLHSVIEATNNQFRGAGYNHRFMAFEYQGEFGIMLADSHTNASFSIVNGIVNADGTFNQSSTESTYQQNVVGLFAATGLVPPDALGFGDNKANLASPPYQTTFTTSGGAANATKLFIPLVRNNYYVNGVERDKLANDLNQSTDANGDGYWSGHIIDKTPTSGQRTRLTYRVDLDLSASGLKAGKTLVVRPLVAGTIRDCGRYLIEDVIFGINCIPSAEYTDIVLYDSEHNTNQFGTGVVSPVGDNAFALYFNSGSVSFNSENSSDLTALSNFRRSFEVFIDQDGKTFTYERSRFVNYSDANTIAGVPLYSDSSELCKINIVKVSPKLRGYLIGNVNKITLTGTYAGDVFTGHLSSYDGVDHTRVGWDVSGLKGQIIRIYDESNIDYIDFIFDIAESISTFSNKILDIQLYPSLALDDEIMLLATCQIRNNQIEYLRDARQFGNISEKDLTTSAIGFISNTAKTLHANGVVRGLDLYSYSGEQIKLKGGSALVNGKFIQKNAESISIPVIQEVIGSTKYGINWAICLNDKGEYQPIPLLDYDATVATPSNEGRVFTAFNPRIATPNYNLEASTFSNIVNNRKDLCLLYVVYSSCTITDPAVNSYLTLATNDVRRYSNNIEDQLPMKLNHYSVNGNFQNVVSMFNWLKFNGNYNNHIIITGSPAVGISDKYTFGIGNSNTIIEGENNAELTFINEVTIGSNITFKNIKLNFNNVVWLDGCSNVLFENCTIHHSFSAATGNSISGGNNIRYSNCNIFITKTSENNGGLAFSISGTNNFSVVNSIIEMTFSLHTASYYPGSIFSCTNSSNIMISNCSALGNFNSFIRTTGAQSNNKVDSCTITTSYDPSFYGTIGYSTSNLVNTGHGYIYSQVSNATNNIIISNNTFNRIGNNGDDRFSFVNIELSTINSSLNNLQIINCKFNCNNSNPALNDFRSAVSIINTAAASDISHNQPVLQNAIIANNTCNRYQSIIITSKFQDTNKMKYPGLAAINCIIENNVCGTIGYWISNGSAYTKPYYSALINTNDSNLVIQNNTCHYITCADETGHYLLLRGAGSPTTNLCDYPSGNVIVQGNSTNWIQVRISYEEQSSLKILNNSLTAFDINYLHSIRIESTAEYDSVAILIRAVVHVNSGIEPKKTNNSACMISGNTTSAGYHISTSNSYPVSYYYNDKLIWCESSNIITNNILRGLNTLLTSSAFSIITVGGTNNIISNNQLYRDTRTINNYVNFYTNDLPAWNGADSTGLVVDNYFDSVSNGTNTNVIYPANANWICERNINQTNGASFIAGGDLTGTKISQQVVSITGASNNVDVKCNSIGFIDSVSPAIYQKQITGSNGNALYVMAQQSIDMTGGNLTLQSGKGVVEVDVFGVPIPFERPGKVRLSSGNHILVELTQNLNGNAYQDRVLSLVKGGAVTPTHMPDGTGDKVIYVGNAATVPTANPTGGAILYASGGGLHVRESGGDSFKITKGGDNYSLAHFASVSVSGFTVPYVLVPSFTSMTPDVITPSFNVLNGDIIKVSCCGQAVSTAGEGMIQLAVWATSTSTSILNTARSFASSSYSDFSIIGIFNNTTDQSIQIRVEGKSSGAGEYIRIMLTTLIVEVVRPLI